MITGDYYSNSNSPYSPARRDPVISFTALPSAGTAGVPTDIVLTWSVEYGTAFSINNGIGTVQRIGNTTVVGVTATTVWTLSVTKLDGTIIQKQATYTAS